MERRTKTEENNDSIMTRFRLPRSAFRTLSIEAVQRDMKPTRFMIELLIGVADKLEQKHKADEAEFG